MNSSLSGQRASADRRRPVAHSVTSTLAATATTSAAAAHSQRKFRLPSSDPATSHLVDGATEGSDRTAGGTVVERRRRISWENPPKTQRATKPAVPSSSSFSSRPNHPTCTRKGERAGSFDAEAYARKIAVEAAARTGASCLRGDVVDSSSSSASPRGRHQRQQQRRHSGFSLEELAYGDIADMNVRSCDPIAASAALSRGNNLSTDTSSIVSSSLDLRPSMREPEATCVNSGKSDSPPSPCIIGVYETSNRNAENSPPRSVAKSLELDTSPVLRSATHARHTHDWVSSRSASSTRDDSDATHGSNAPGARLKEPATMLSVWGGDVRGVPYMVAVVSDTHTYIRNANYSFYQ